jgi:hypothetical protein
VAFVPAVPEAVAGGFVAADLILALLAVLAWAVCYGLLSGWNYSLGFLLDKLAGVLSFRVLRVNVDLGGPVRELNHVVRVSLAKGVSTADHAMGLFFYWLGLLIGWMVNFAKLTAQDTLALANWMTHIHLPKYAKWAIRAAFPLAWLTKLIGQEIAKALPKVGHIAKAAATSTVTVVEKIPRAIDRRLTKAEKTLGALAAAIAALGGAIHLPHPVATPGAVWRGLTKRMVRAERRLRRLEALFGAAAMAAVMANVLGVSVRCLRSGNVGRAARALCGFDKWLLDLLLVGSIEAFIAADLCDFSDLLIAEAESLRPTLMALVDVENALVGCHDFTAPRSFTLPPVSLPALVDAVSLAA